ARLGPIVEDDQLGGHSAHARLQKGAVRRGRAPEEVDMVETPDAYTAIWRALRLILERGPLVFRGAVLFRLVIDFQQVAIGIGELIGFAVAGIALDPASAMAIGFEGLREPFQRPRTVGAEGGMADAWLRRFGQFERVKLILAPGA